MQSSTNLATQPTIDLGEHCEHEADQLCAVVTYSPDGTPCRSQLMTVNRARGYVSAFNYASAINGFWAEARAVSGIATVGDAINLPRMAAERLMAAERKTQARRKTQAKRSRKLHLARATA